MDGLAQDGNDKRSKHLTINIKAMAKAGVVEMRNEWLGGLIVV